jgi:5,10-methylene-tetrahydrofolate dehydrogenase/methenyl tetrahydrofolate cyclohydrolase
LAAQGIDVSDEQIATYENQAALKDLPSPALVFTATPVAEQIRNEDIPGGSVMIDAGFGVIDGVTYGNTDRRAADRSDVLWTPPREGVGPVSTAYLFHHHLEAAGYPMEDLPPLGFVALQEVAVY